jgi:hypothetical protein
MAAEDRKKREHETREKEAHAASMYVPPSVLPDPDPEPGMTFRYCAKSVMGQLDPTNMSKRLREGWVPVMAVDHPELQIVGDANGNVEIGGLILCKMPTAKVKARDAYYATQAKGQMQSVDNHFMKNSDPRMPLFSEKRSETQRGFGSGSK